MLSVLEFPALKGRRAPVRQDTFSLLQEDKLPAYTMRLLIYSLWNQADPDNGLAPETGI